jgi:hypothetical protein
LEQASCRGGQEADLASGLPLAIGQLGGEASEPREENPMIGFRGASRYYDERYRVGINSISLSPTSSLKIREMLLIR